MIFTVHVTTQDPLVLCEMVAYIIILLSQVISCTEYYRFLLQLTGLPAVNLCGVHTFAV